MSLPDVGWGQPPLTAPKEAPRLSAAVTAHNEEVYLADCLRSLRWADEIVVLLDRCDDGSAAIAQEHADRVLEGAWPDQVDRRVAVLDACTGDWIIELDADERATPELAAEVPAAIAGAEPGYFVIPFDNYVGDRLVRHGWGGSWSVSAAARLFSRGAKEWPGPQRIHPPVRLYGRKGRLQGRIVHLIDRDIGDMIRRLDRYTERRARDMRDFGTDEGFGRNLRRILTRFWLSYVRRGGYREGYYGFAVALMTAIWPVLAWLRYRLETTERTERPR